VVAVPSVGRADQSIPSNAPAEADLQRLYEQYARQIQAYCLHQLGNREEAEDATQITFLNAFRGLKRGTSPEFESAWLYKIAHNVCLTKQRNSYRRRLVEAPSDFELIEEIVPAHEGDTDELFGLSSALRVLPEQQRRALLLREWQGLSYREIAEEMQLSQAAVETLLFRARRSLAEALSADPAERRKRGRPRAANDASAGAAALKSLLMGGGFKGAATAATVAATSVVAATPVVRHSFAGPVLRTDAADRPHRTLLVRPHPAEVVPPPHVSMQRLVAAPHATAKHPVVTPFAAPVVRLHLVAAPRIVAPAVEPAPPVHEVVHIVALAPAPAPVPAAAPAPTPAPAVEAAPAADPIPAPAVVDVPAAPDPAPSPAPAPKPSVAPARTAAPVTTPPPTITVATVMQPADPAPAAPVPDPAAATNVPPPADPSWVPPGQAKRDPAADPATTLAPATPAVTTTTDDTTAPAPAWTPPGQARKADNPGHGNDR